MTLVLSVLLGCAAASTPDAPVADFSAKVRALCGAGPISITYDNRAGLDGERLKVLQRALETELRADGVKLAPGAPALSITFSKNERGWLWIATFGEGANLRVTMFEVAEAPVSAFHSTLSLRKQLWFEWPAPVLDAVKLQTAEGPALVALSTDELLLFIPSGSGWTLRQEVRFERDLPMPRDARGHLVTASDHLFDAYLPGMVCNSGNTVPLTVTCRDGDDLWPIGGQNAFFNASRNYFTGLMRPGFAKPVAPFYSAGSVSIGNRDTWIFAGLDGKVLFTEGGAESPLPGTADWGSDIASVPAQCGAGTEMLVTSRSSDPGSDSIRAYEVMNRSVTPSSSAMSVTGTVTSLWSHASSTATAAVYDSGRGTYAVYGLEVSCD